MNDNIYTIKRICKELDQPRQKVRRRLVKLDIEAINENTRTYKNEPLKYDYQAFFELAEEFNVQINEDECTADVKHRTTNVQHRTSKNDDKDKLIEVLEEQLKEANKSKTNLEKLLDQQQQLTMLSNRELESVKLELEEEKWSENEAEKTNKWWQFWKY
ncbi:MAG: hypothetical protein L0J96_10900 [Lactococcus lactis]|uniref:hypothetical protein n=1 Tax=Senegalia sp. (in: firmicutes) TaxID=1924098 RepID=UPI00264F238B|nr:hypothetical protein [Lactococcus lactis]